MRFLSLLAQNGLYPFGMVALEPDEIAGEDASHGLLIANHADENGEHKMWQVFSASNEFSDGGPDPLDRWTKRIVGNIAKKAGLAVRYPFGEPHYPFQAWAMRSRSLKPSPLGILIDLEYGLWFAFRALLLLPEKPEDLPQLMPTGLHPCDHCTEKPCLSACPVNAVSTGSFDVVTCRSGLKNGDPGDCYDKGCGARNACPISTPYPPDQLRFHMAAIKP